MAANSFVFLFSCLLVGGLTYFQLRKATTRADVGKLALAFAFIGIFFLVNAFFAYMGYRSLLAAINTPPMRSIDEFERAGTGAEVILDGTISADTPLVMADYVAYIECDEESCTRYLPSNLLIALDGGDVAISNDDFEDREWPISSDDVLFLAPAEPVIVVGMVERGVVLFGKNKGRETLSLNADIVYAGSHEGFVSRARQKMVFPIVMLIFNLVAVAGVILLPWAIWYLRPKDGAAD